MSAYMKVRALREEYTKGESKETSRLLKDVKALPEVQRANWLQKLLANVFRIGAFLSFDLQIIIL